MPPIYKSYRWCGPAAANPSVRLLYTNRHEYVYTYSYFGSGVGGSRNRSTAQTTHSSRQTVQNARWSCPNAFWTIFSVSPYILIVAVVNFHSSWDRWFNRKSVAENRWTIFGPVLTTKTLLRKGYWFRQKSNRQDRKTEECSRKPTDFFGVGAERGTYRWFWCWERNVLVILMLRERCIGNLMLREECIGDFDAEREVYRWFWSWERSVSVILTLREKCIGEFDIPDKENRCIGPRS